MAARKNLLIPCLLLLASCSSPPRPPAPAPATRRPANAQVQVELQQCRNELHNARIQTLEAGQLAESASVTLKSLVAMQKTLMARQDVLRATLQGHEYDKAQPSEQGNAIYTVRFQYGSSRVYLPGESARRLIEQAKQAPLILLRGRTDGIADVAAESRIARERASAVREFLVAAGVAGERIRATYQPAGDHVADNASAEGRSLNRRVEIELYRQLPVSIDMATL